MRAVMILKSQAVSARVTKDFVTIFSKTCNNVIFKNRLLYCHYTLWKVLFCVNNVKALPTFLTSVLCYRCIVD